MCAHIHLCTCTCVCVCRTGANLRCSPSGIVHFVSKGPTLSTSLLLHTWLICVESGDWNSSLTLVQMSHLLSFLLFLRQKSHSPAQVPRELLLLASFSLIIRLYADAARLGSNVNPFSLVLGLQDTTLGSSS